MLVVCGGPRRRRRRTTATAPAKTRHRCPPLSRNKSDVSSHTRVTQDGCLRFNDYRYFQFSSATAFFHDAETLICGKEWGNTGKKPGVQGVYTRRGGLASVGHVLSTVAKFSNIIEIPLLDLIRTIFIKYVLNQWIRVYTKEKRMATC